MSIRMEKVASLIKHEVGMLFTREYSDGTYGLLTVTEVRMTPDLKIAKIYVSILGNEEVRQRTMGMLEDKKPSIRQTIGTHVRLKFTPAIQFYLDDTMDRVERINNLIKGFHKDDETDIAS